MLRLQVCDTMLSFENVDISLSYSLKKRGVTTVHAGMMASGATGYVDTKYSVSSLPRFLSGA
jgi:hypothetical protein